MPKTNSISRNGRTPAGRHASPNLVVVGSVALDILHTATASTGLVLGGSATHFANAASFFTSLGVVGIVGDDFPLKELDFLRKRGVDFEGLAVQPGESFLWEGRYSADFLQRETIQTRLGVFAEFKPVLPPHYRKPKVLFLAAIHPELQLDVLKQVERPKLVGIDTFKLWIDTARKPFLKVLKQADMFFVNDDEVRWLTGDHNLLRGAKALLKMGPRWIIVKKGEHGSFLLTEKGVAISATFPVDEVVDPTGAGDAYAGGVLGYLTREGRVNPKTIRQAMSWASVIGSYYVEGFSIDGLKSQTITTLARRHRRFCEMCTVPIY